MLIANAINELGRFLDRQGRRRLGDSAYAFASWLDADWDAPWFNRGITAKMERRWQDCRRFNLRATEIEPSFAPAWWNLGIAATALEDWPLARRAWMRYGIDIPLGEGPPNLNFGAVPIRVVPELAAEVVWCHRVDPARAIIESVPLPESTRAFGDVLLHDGEPKGHRMHREREVPVFNELQLLTPSAFDTFQANVTAPDPEAASQLEAMALPREVAIEDWSSMRMLCTACSEGKPHDHEPADLKSCSPTWRQERMFGIAASSLAAAEQRLQLWLSAAPGRHVESIQCVFSRR